MTPSGPIASQPLRGEIVQTKQDGDQTFTILKFVFPARRCDQPAVRLRCRRQDHWRGAWRSHELQSVDSSKIAFVSLAAVANRTKPLQRTMSSWHIEVRCGGGGRLARRASGECQNTRRSNSRYATAVFPEFVCARPSSTRSNRRGADPYAKWWRREASPYPDHSPLTWVRSRIPAMRDCPQPPTWLFCVDVDSATPSLFRCAGPSATFRASGGRVRRELAGAFNANPRA